MEISDSGEVQLTEEEFDQINKMVCGISWKRHGWSGLEADDIMVELWLKVMQVLKDCREVNLPLLAGCCWNRSMDLCRAAKRQKERCFSIPNAYEIFEDSDQITDEYDGSASRGSNVLRKYEVDDCDSNMSIKAMLDLFPPDSKEYEYIQLSLLYNGLVETYYKDPTKKFDDVFGNQRRELELAWKLGFANDTSSGYRNLRDRVRNKIIENGLRC